eukprot:COSAG01_NODE_9652_length_2379_cov_3.000439_1_plen_274_part_00
MPWQRSSVVALRGALPRRRPVRAPFVVVSSPWAALVLVFLRNRNATGAGGDNGIAQMWNRREISVSSYGDNPIISPRIRTAATGTVWNDEACTLGGGGSLAGKTVFIAGGSRGIGFCIAKTAARDGANVVIGGKTADPHPTLPGTIFSAAADCEALGGRSLACVVDVRDEASIEAAVAAAVDKFGGIDVLINCASAIFPQATEDFNTSRFNLMFEVGPRGSMLTAKHCLPHLKKSAQQGRNPHVLNLSPPIVQKRIGQANYMINKLGMTVSWA